MADERTRLRDRPVLVAVAVGLAVGELAIVNLLGPQTALAGVPQVTRTRPFDVFHDLRWLAVYVPSWFVFVVALAGFFVARTAVTAVLVAQAWPRGCRAATGTRARRAVPRGRPRSSTVLLVPWVVMLFATAVFSLSYLWIVAVPVVVMISLVVHQSAITTQWWRLRPRAASVGPIVVTFAALTVVGALIAGGSPVAPAPLVIAAGVVNAWCWLRVTHAVVGQPASTRGRPFVVVALAGILALVVGGAAIGFAVAAALERGRDPLPRARASATGPPVLVIKGFNSQWNGTTLRWVTGNFRIRRFSYSGLDARGAPRPYGRDATHRSVRGARPAPCSDQVEALRRRHRRADRHRRRERGRARRADVPARDARRPGARHRRAEPARGAGSGVVPGAGAGGLGGGGRRRARRRGDRRQRVGADRGACRHAACFARSSRTRRCSRA